MFLYDVTMIMPNGDQVTERVRAEDEGYAARQAAAKWGFKTWHESTKNRVAIRRRIPIGLIPTGGVSVAPGMRSRPKRASQMNAEAPASRQVPHTSWCSPGRCARASDGSSGGPAAGWGTASAGAGHDASTRADATAAREKPPPRADRRAVLSRKLRSGYALPAFPAPAAPSPIPTPSDHFTPTTVVAVFCSALWSGFSPPLTGGGTATRCPLDDPLPDTLTTWDEAERDQARGELAMDDIPTEDGVATSGLHRVRRRNRTPEAF